MRLAIAGMLIGTLACAGLLLSSSAYANIHRSCDAWYEIKYVYIDGIKPYKQGSAFGSFSATRSCGATVPNRCRERARGALESCMRVHWQVRWDRIRPTHCTSAEGVNNYTIADIKTELEREACCTAANALSFQKVTVDLYGFTGGDTGCGSGSSGDARRWSRFRIQSGYYADCVALRANGLCN
jgi:hypothetical protein